MQIFFHGTEPPMNRILEILSDNSISVISTNVNIAKPKKGLSEIIFFVNIPKKLDVKKLVKEMKSIAAIDTISLKEKLGAFR